MKLLFHDNPNLPYYFEGDHCNYIAKELMTTPSDPHNTYIFAIVLLLSRVWKIITNGIWIVMVPGRQCKYHAQFPLPLGEIKHLLIFTY